MWAGMLNAGLGDAHGRPRVRLHRQAARRSRDTSRWRRPATSRAKTPRAFIDNVLTFDKLTDVFNSGTMHEEDQPCHLHVADTDICRDRCTVEYGNPCQYFCPAAVYEPLFERTPTARSRAGCRSTSPTACTARPAISPIPIRSSPGSRRRAARVPSTRACDGLVMSHDNGDVIVAGAGLIGLAIAFELAERGAAVRVYDRAEPARAASWAGAGMLAPYTERIADEAMLALCARLARGVSARSSSASPAAAASIRTSSSTAFLTRPSANAELDALRAQARSVATQRGVARRFARPRAGARERTVAGGIAERRPSQTKRRPRRQPAAGRALSAACRSRGVRIERTSSWRSNATGAACSAWPSIAASLPPARS